MEMNDAVEALAALAHPGRLSAFRLLVRAEPEGLPAGSLADALGVPSSTLSSHLSALTRVGLAVFERRGRIIIYRAQLQGMRTLVGYLVEDCCAGVPAACGLTLTAESKMSTGGAS